MYNKEDLTLFVDGNVYLKAARPYIKETNYVELSWSDPKMKIVEDSANVYFNITLDKLPKSFTTKLITTELLGKAKASGLAYENSDGSPLKIDQDYFGKKRKEKNPTPGPFENPGNGMLKLKLW